VVEIVLLYYTSSMCTKERESIFKRHDWENEENENLIFFLNFNIKLYYLEILL